MSLCFRTVFVGRNSIHPGNSASPAPSSNAEQSSIRAAFCGMKRPSISPSGQGQLLTGGQIQFFVAQLVEVSGVGVIIFELWLNTRRNIAILVTHHKRSRLFLSALKGKGIIPFEWSSETISVLTFDVIAASIPSIELKYWELLHLKDRPACYVLFWPNFESIYDNSIPRSQFSWLPDCW